MVAQAPVAGSMEKVRIVSGGRVGGLLDVHAAFGGGHHRDPAGFAVHQQRQVERLGDGGAFLDVEAVHLLALGARLVGHQGPAQHLGGVGTSRPRRT